MLTQVWTVPCHYIWTKIEIRSKKRVSGRKAVWRNRFLRPWRMLIQREHNSKKKSKTFFTIPCVTHFVRRALFNTDKIITKEDTRKFNRENGILDPNGKPREGITGAYYTKVKMLIEKFSKISFFHWISPNLNDNSKEMLCPFKKYLDGIMKQRYPNPDERSNEYKKMYFEQGSAHSGSRYL